MARNFPDAIELPNATVPLSYEFAPGEEHDGITLSVPRALLAGVRAADVEFAVPGLLRDLVLVMLRALPKSMRRRVGPAADAVRRYLLVARREDEALHTSLARFLSTQCAVEVAADFWNGADVQARIPVHLRVRYRLLDDDGELLACSRDLQALQLQYVRARDQVGGEARGADASHKRWDFGALPARVRVEHAGASGWVFPALGANDDGVLLTNLDSEKRARAVHSRGLLRLAISASDIDVGRLMKSVRDSQQLCLLNTVVSVADDGMPAGDQLLQLKGKDRGPCAQLIHDVVLAALANAFSTDGDWTVRDRSAFEQYCRAGLSSLDASIDAQRELTWEILEGHRKVRGLIGEQWPRAYEANLTDARSQLHALVHHGFLVSVPARKLQHLPRYLHGLQLRLEKLRQGGAHDTEKLQQLAPHWARYQSRAGAHARRGRRDEALADYRWLVEEYRISLFAQELGTQQKVSKQRLDRQWALVPP